MVVAHSPVLVTKGFAWHNFLYQALPQARELSNPPVSSHILDDFQWEPCVCIVAFLHANDVLSRDSNSCGLVL